MSVEVTLSKDNFQGKSLANGHWEIYVRSGETLILTPIILSDEQYCQLCDTLINQNGYYPDATLSINLQGGQFGHRMLWSVNKLEVL